MGVFAEGFMAYIQPLLDQADGSTDQLNRAFSVGQMCWNLALSPEESRDEALEKMRPTLKMDDDEFEEFRRFIITPMVRRHKEMFPGMSNLGSMEPARRLPVPKISPSIPVHTSKHPGTGRNATCPCQSGRKYKHCCGR